MPAGRIATGICGALLLVVPASCGLEVAGSATNEAIGPEPDGSPGISEDATASGDAAPLLPPASCEPALPTGWSPLAWSSSRAAPCPADYATTDLVLEPSSTTGACTCGCTISTTDPPSCAKGTLRGWGGTGASCNQSTVAYNVNGSACTSVGMLVSLGAVGEYDVLPLYRGTCTASAVKNDAAVVPTLGRACSPSPAAAPALCGGAAPSGFSACIIHEDDVACPPGPYAIKTVTGSGVSLTCGGCETCQNAATCPASVTLRYYDDSNCAVEVGSRVLNGNCNSLSTGAPGNYWSRFRYDVVTGTPTCAPTSTATTQVALETQRTVCCR